MGTHTTTTATGRRSKRGAATLLALAICLIAVPASATAAEPGYSSINAITGAPSESSPAVGFDYSSVNSLAPPSTASGSVSDSGGSVANRPGYTSLSAIVGPQGAQRTFASGSGSDSGAEFSWGDAALGAGAALALVMLAGSVVALRRRTRISTSPTTG
jgi:hypothetical protein